MNLMDYVRVLVRRWWIIAALVAFTVASAFVFSRVQTPVYRSTQKILLQPSRIDLGLAEATTRLIRSYVVWLYSNDRAREVIETLQLDMMPGDLLSNVRIDPDESRLLIQIDVDLPDGELANDIARQWGVLFVEWRNEQNQRTRFEDRIQAIRVDDPVYSQVQPNTAVNVIAGTVLGLLLGGVIVFVLEYLESNIIRHDDDVRRSLDITVLGTIPPEEARS